MLVAPAADLVPGVIVITDGDRCAILEIARDIGRGAGLHPHFERATDHRAGVGKGSSSDGENTGQDQNDANKLLHERILLMLSFGDLILRKVDEVCYNSGNLAERNVVSDVCYSARCTRFLLAYSEASSALSPMESPPFPVLSLLTSTQ